MNKSKIIFFIFLAILQLLVPAYMIISRESALKHGELYKFKTRPADPFDAMRGRYVQLSFEKDQIECDGVVLKGYYRNETPLYLSLKKDAAGYVIIDKCSITQPKHDNYLKITRWYSYKKIRVTYPFNQYFMNEYDAPIAEKVYNEVQLKRKVNVYAAVRVYKGIGVIENIYFDEVPIMEFLEQYKK